MYAGLDEDECNALFRKMDANHSGDISYTEIVEMFSDINT
jgi:Ca2+-binding EF-hand superfamily protein